MHNTCVSVHRSPKADANGHWLFSGQQTARQRTDCFEIIVGISALGTEHAPMRPPFTFAAYQHSSRVFSATKIEREKQWPVTHTHTILRACQPLVLVPGNRPNWN
jgi:hypothetical protein